MPESRSPAGAPRRGYGGLAALVPLAVSAIVQYPVTRGCFRADDFLNLYQIANYSPWQYLVIPNAGHLLLTRNAIFYVSWLLFGAHAWPYLWAAFLTHLVNVALLYFVIDRYTASRSAAVLGATLWGACALHVDAVGYYAVYGHVLVGSALLLILLSADRAADLAVRPVLLVLWYALALGAATCFGTGIALAMVLPVVLALLLPGWRRAWRSRLPLISLLIVVPLLYFALHKLYQIAFAVQGVRDPFQRMIESLGSVPTGMVRTLAFAMFRLLLRPLPVESAFPAAYFMLGATALALALYAWRAPSLVRRRIAACLVLAVACYGVVVMARLFRVYDMPASVMDSDGRLHYAPLIPLTILLAFLWQALSARLPQVSGLAVGVLCIALALPSIGPVPVDERCIGTGYHLKKALMRIAVTMRMAPPEQMDIVIPNRRFPPSPMSVVFPGWAGVFAIFYPSNTVNGRRVVFIENDPQVVDWAQRGRRSRTLLIPPPPEVPSMEPEIDWSPTQLQPQLSAPPADDSPAPLVQ